MQRRHMLQLMGAAGLALALPARAGTAPLEAAGGRAFGSYWRVVRPAGGPPVGTAVAEVIRAVDAAFSPYLAGSELSRLNAVPTADARPASAEFRAVLASALDVAGRTGGAFDPTVGPVVARYGFGPIRGGAGDLSDIAVAGTGVRTGAATLDLCGIAKGRALDRMGAALRAAGVTDALVELGGEVRAMGRHPDGRPWQVAVETPGTGAPAAALALADRAVATSGAFPQGYDVAGRRYSHIVDPTTRAPATGDLGSVSVIADTAMEADALATALYAAGTDGALDLAERLGLDTLMLVRDGSGWRSVATGQADAMRLG